MIFQNPCRQNPQQRPKTACRNGCAKEKFAGGRTASLGRPDQHRLRPSARQRDAIDHRDPCKSDAFRVSETGSATIECRYLTVKRSHLPCAARKRNGAAGLCGGDGGEQACDIPRRHRGNTRAEHSIRYHSDGSLPVRTNILGTLGRMQPRCPAIIARITRGPPRLSRTANGPGSS